MFGRFPFGEYPELAAQWNEKYRHGELWRPCCDRGGLLFIGATNYDKKFRAFDKSTGTLFWETTLPFSGNATPTTYEVNGRQFVVIAAGGGKDLNRSPAGCMWLLQFRKNRTVET